MLTPTLIYDGHPEYKILTWFKGIYEVGIMNGRDVRLSDGTPTYSYNEIGLDAPLCHAVTTPYGHSSVQAWGTMSKMTVCSFIYISLLVTMLIM